jgi:tetratricopeptide (TPR) repeat protein
VGSLLRSLLGRDPQERPFSAQKLRRTLDPFLPDGAAVTRQPTKTFANVPDAKKATPREPTGTLRPPAPPGPPPSASLIGASGQSSEPRASAATAGKPAGRVSVPPPPPGQAKPAAETRAQSVDARGSAREQNNDHTQRLDIEQILSSVPVQPRASMPPAPPPRASVAPPPPPTSPAVEARGPAHAPAPPAPRPSAPPPAPAAARASLNPPGPPARPSLGPPPPPARPSLSPPVPPAPAGRAPLPPARGPKKDPTEAIDFAEVLDESGDEDATVVGDPLVEARPQSELTQPIRLEQVLAVADARARKSVPSPQSGDARGPAPAQEPAVPAQPAAPAAQAPNPAPLAAPAVALSAASQPSADVDPEAATVIPAVSRRSGEPLRTSDASPAAPQTDPVLLARGPARFDSLDVTIEAHRQSTERPAPQPAAAPAITAVAPPDDLEQEDSSEDEATSVAFKPAMLSMASQKRTLIGRAAPDAFAPVGSRAAGNAREPAQPDLHVRDQEAIQANQTPTHTFDPLTAEVRRSATGRQDLEDTLDGVQAPRFVPPALLRQYWPHAAAALVLLAVGGALISALGAGDESAAVASLNEAAPAPAAAPPALPTPSVMPLAAAPTDARPASTAPVVQAASPTTTSAQQDAADEEDADDTADEARDEREPERKVRGHHGHRQHRRAERAAKASAKSAPAKGASSDSKEERWAKARQEAQAYYAAKKYKQAAQAYEIAAKNNPTHPGTFAGLGASRLKAGDARGAVQAYQKAVQLSPTTSGFHAALGRAYAAMGDKGKARAAYKRALALDPKNDAAKTALKELG